MSFIHSPFERVREVGLRIVEFRNVLNAGAWDMDELDTKLKALRDDNGGIPLPNGVAETVAVMRKAFEDRPQIMERALSLYDQEYKKFAPTQPPAPPQTITVQFDQPTTSTPGDTPGDVEISVSLITSDAEVSEEEVTVAARDLLTGSALTPAQYTMVTPQVLVFPAGTASGAVLPVTLTNAGSNGATATVDLDLDPGSVVNAALGAQATHEVTIVNIGA